MNWEVAGFAMTGDNRHERNTRREPGGTQWRNAKLEPGARSVSVLGVPSSLFITLESLELEHLGCSPSPGRSLLPRFASSVTILTGTQVTSLGASCLACSAWLPGLGVAILTGSLAVPPYSRRETRPHRGVTLGADAPGLWVVRVLGHSILALALPGLEFFFDCFDGYRDGITPTDVRSTFSVD